jgi:hypothetical protein
MNNTSTSKMSPAQVLKALGGVARAIVRDDEMLRAALGQRYESECEGHPAEDCGMPFAAIGETVFCDGSCVPA